MSTQNQSQIHPKKRGWKRILFLGIGVALAASLAGYFTLPYLSLIGAPVAELGTGDIAEASFMASDGKSHQFSEYRGRVLVLEWTSPVCEFTIRHYESGAMQALQEYAAGKKASWIPITTAAPGSASYIDAAGLQKLLADRKISSPFIAMDETGLIGHMFGAHATPSVAIIDATGKLAYMGAIDDQPWGDGSTGINHVRAALDELATGKPVTVSFTRSYGCSIKYPDAPKKQ
jgi:hypothetical protein